MAPPAAAGASAFEGEPGPSDDPAAPTISSAPQFVVKISKYCNLRCDYCYEFPHLGDKARMTLSDIRAFFENIRASVDDLSISKADFIWHGGEPLLIPADYYEQMAAVQAEVLGTSLEFVNTVQTNLTVLTDRHLALLKSGFFSRAGVSFDVYGDQRVDRSGRLRTDTVLANLQKLVDHGVGFAAIAVLARNTLPHVPEIYRFFDDLHITHRFLPYYKSTGDAQAERHALGYEEIVAAYKKLFHEWLASAHATRVEPIDDYIRYAVLHLTGGSAGRYDPAATERIYVIDVNGDVYNAVESYDPDFCYGNLFRTPLLEIAASPARRRSNALARERMRHFCEPCPYFGACPGGFVASATPQERKLLATGGCPVRELIGYIVDVFRQTDLERFVLETYAMHAEPRDCPALDVA